MQGRIYSKTGGIHGARGRSIALTRFGQARGGKARILMTTGQTVSNNATREKLGNERANIFVANRVFK
jgi:hypothetical protein